MRILDLFAGVGGTSKGIHRAAAEQNVKLEYVAIDYDPSVLYAHQKFCPEDFTILRNAWNYDFSGYDFIWASPPCQSHSVLNYTLRRYDPDMRLYELIKKLRNSGKDFIVENVHPYYQPPIPWNFEVNRHVFWSNLPIPSFRVVEKRKAFGELGVTDLLDYHGVDKSVLSHVRGAQRRRQLLRNMVNPEISRRIFQEYLDILEGAGQRTIIEFESVNVGVEV